MSALVHLQEIRLRPVPEVVACLQDILARAEAGEIRGFALVASCDQGGHSTTYELGDGSLGDLIVATLRLQSRLLKIGGEDVP